VFSSRGAFLLFIALAELACRKQTPGPPPRYAILSFENLSGNPSLDWTGRAASETLAVSLHGAMDGPVLTSAELSGFGPALGPRPVSAPGISSEHQEARAAGATRLIEGYVERAGSKVRITATEEDLSTGKSLRIVTAADTSPLAALNKIARQFSSHPKPPPTENLSALRLYSIALESPAADSIGDLEQALRLDPDFGAAWVTLAGTVARTDRAAAEDVIARARQHKLDPLTLATLDLDAASLHSDRSARIEAMRKIASLSPGDDLPLRTLAEAETGAGQFAAAAADWKKLTILRPDDPLAWNNLGYARSYAGDYNGALAALREYARLRPKDANPHDSIGDLNYSWRKFTEAAAAYLRAHTAQPDFEQYGDLYKAAWAKFRAGDKAGADALFSQFRAQRTKTADGLMPLLVADWLYRTGRKSEAIAALRSTVAGTASAPVRGNGYSQLTIWDLLAHDREQAGKDALAIGPRLLDGPMLISRFAALPSAGASEWETRANRLIPASMGTLRRLALGYALLLDGKREAAIPVWEQIAEESGPTDFFSRAVDKRLRNKPLEHPLLPDPVNLNQFMGVLDSL